jgi:hypothetical protein
VLLLTSTNLTANPRLQKELQLLVELGAFVQVVAFHLSAWTDKYDEAVSGQYSPDRVRFHYLQTNRQHLFRWLFYSIGEWVGRLLLPFLPSSMICAAAAISKRSLQLLNWNIPAGFKPDLVIAHNPAAFYPAYFFARKWSASFALDVEDYHPGENIASSVKVASARLMDKLLDKAAYVSYASPLIREHSLKHTKRKSENHLVVNNVFPQTEFRKLTKESSPTSKLKLVWFSQHVDYGRGIERILPILDRYSDSFQLTLIGSCRPIFRKQEVEKRNYIVCKEPLSQAELHAELGLHDIGLALEDPMDDLNRDICLTNKIWAYFQSGLFILATDTLAQRSFIHQFPDHGVLTSFSPESVRKIVEYLLANRSMIFSGYTDRFEKSKSHSWEQQSGQLIGQWRMALNLPVTL